MDAVDAALCHVIGNRIVAIEATLSSPYPEPVRSQLLALQASPDAAVTIRDIARLDIAVARCFSDTVDALLRTAAISAEDVAAIGSHGQTVFHDASETGNTIQLGNPSWIAVRSGIPVVADFRRADMALAGQGAPLVPAFHQSIAGHSRPCVVLNIGGIANVTVVDDDTTGFDTGPGNALMDEWVHLHRGEPFDRDGAWAATGALDEELLSACLGDAYFSAPPPKSTGRDYFNLDWLRRRHPGIESLPADTVQRTLCELTARSITDPLATAAAEPRRMYVCGGGARNHFLLERIRALAPQLEVTTTDAVGIAPEWVEAAAFAWLAWQRVNDRPGNLPSVTGASRPAVLGALYHP